MSFADIGSTLSGLNVFNRVLDYFKRRRETGEIGKALERSLHSIEDIRTSHKEVEKLGPSLFSFLEAHDFPLTTPQFEEVVGLLNSYSISYRTFLEAILSFADECRQLLTFEGFMGKVKELKPDVYDIIAHFGSHYRANDKTLDINDFPMLISLMGDKSVWRDDPKRKKVVSEYVKTAKDITKKVKASRGHHYNIRDRRPAMECLRNFNRLAATVKRFHAKKELGSNIRNSAPDWYQEVVGIFDLVPDLLGSSREKGFYPPRKPPRPARRFPR